MQGEQITLPWPPRELSPNARAHHLAKARIAKAYREQSYWIAKIDPLPMPADGEILLRLDFHPPDNRARDLDNMLASAKAGIDGLADAHQVNDRRFAFAIHRAEPRKNGAIIITLASELTPATDGARAG